MVGYMQIRCKSSKNMQMKDQRIYCTMHNVTEKWISQTASCNAPYQTVLVCLQLQLFPLQLEVSGISVHWQLCCGPCGRKNDARLDSGMSVRHTMYWWDVSLSLRWVSPLPFRTLNLFGMPPAHMVTGSAGPWTQVLVVFSDATIQLTYWVTGLV